MLLKDGHNLPRQMMVIYNVADSQVDYQGNVTLLTQAIYMSKCTIDVTYYPFDSQICELKFASWTTEVTRVLELHIRIFCIILLQLNMSVGHLNEKEILGLYSPSGVLLLKKIYAKRHEEHDPCCEDKFADVT